MKVRTLPFLCLLSTVPCLLALAGCSFTKPQTDPTRFYVLSTAAGGASVAPAAGAPAVHVRPVEIASYIRARPLIVRRGDNEIEFREYARWGEPLEQGIARVLREELLARGAASAVAITGVRAANRPYDYELTVRVLACEGLADGGVEFRARWDVAVAGNKAQPLVAQGEFRAEGLAWDGKTEATLAAQISRAVAGLATEIGARLPKK